MTDTQVRSDMKANPVQAKTYPPASRTFSTASYQGEAVEILRRNLFGIPGSTLVRFLNRDAVACGASSLLNDIHEVTEVRSAEDRLAEWMTDRLMDAMKGVWWLHQPNSKVLRVAVDQMIEGCHVANVPYVRTPNGGIEYSGSEPAEGEFFSLHTPQMDLNRGEN